MDIEKNRENSLKTDIKRSILFHAIVLGIFSIKNIFFSSPDIQYQSAIRVDMVDLPDKIVKQARVKPQAKKEKITPQKKVPKAKPKKAKQSKAINLKSKQKSAIDRLEALNKIKEQKERDDNQKSALEKIKEFKGNALSKGSSLTGVVQDQFNAYVSEMDTHVKQFWSLPRWLSEKNLNCQVTIKIDSRGYVIFRQIAQSSGNPSFDDLAVSTVDQASPFPPPPSSLTATLEAKGFTIEFFEQED